MFELGPPVMLDAATLKTMKISRFERVGYCTLMYFLYFICYTSPELNGIPNMHFRGAIFKLITLVLTVPHIVLKETKACLYASF